MGVCESVDRLLKEIDGVMGGLDGSGLRGGYPRVAQTSRDPHFPYDNTEDETQVGVQAKMGEPLHHFLVPKNIDPDDSRWDEDEPKNLADIEEAMGTPMNFTMSGRSNRGNDIPGSSGGWSHPPTHPWDKDETEKQMDYYGSHDVKEDMDPEVPPTEPVENPFGSNFEDESDEEIEDEIESSRTDGDNIFSKDDAGPGDIFSGEPIEVELIAKRPTGLDLVDAAVAQIFCGLLPVESAWASLTNLAR